MTTIFDGVALGMLLFLISVGLSVTLGLMNFVNLAHGVFAMIGGYTCTILLNSYGVPFLATLPAAVIVAAVAGGILERLLYRRLYDASELDQVLFSIGLVFMAVASAHFLFGPHQQPLHLPAFLSGRIHFLGMDLGIYRLFLVVAGLIVAFLLQWSVIKTSFGARLRAAVDNQRVARGMGIDVNRVFSMTFVLGSGLAGLGGALGVQMLGMDPEYPLKYLVFFLIVVTVGGSGNIMGSLYAAIILGVADVVGKYYVPQIGAFIIYAVMVITLVVRPYGLFGSSNRGL